MYSIENELNAFLYFINNAIDATNLRQNYVLEKNSWIFADNIYLPNQTFEKTNYAYAKVGATGDHLHIRQI